MLFLSQLRRIDKAGEMGTDQAGLTLYDQRVNQR